MTVKSKQLRKCFIDISKDLENKTLLVDVFAFKFIVFTFQRLYTYLITHLKGILRFCCMSDFFFFFVIMFFMLPSLSLESDQPE